MAAYCRVSTDSDEQVTSYEAQIEHYTIYIKGHPAWTLAGIFADDRISGTNSKKRDKFNRMIDERMAGQIDMIITKSIRRWWMWKNKENKTTLCQLKPEHLTKYYRDRYPIPLKAEKYDWQDKIENQLYPI